MRIIAVILLFLAHTASAETLQAEDFVGEWCDPGSPPSFQGKLMYWLSGQPNHGMKLKVDESLEIHFQRTLDSDSVEKIGPPLSHLEIHDDLYLVYLPRESGDSYKLVLSGWRIASGSRMIFGYFYLYNKDGVFNGWPVSFKVCNGT